MAEIFHLALADDWAAAQEAGDYTVSTRGMSIDEVGFLHGAFAAQVEGVAGRFYADVSEGLLLLTLDAEDLDEYGLQIVVEPAIADDETSETFPHVYGGNLPVAAVSDVQPYMPQD